MNLLCIDDSSEIQLIVKRLFNSEYQVFAAYSLNECKNLLNQFHFDLIFLDLSLPDGDGLSLFQLSEFISQNQTPVIVISSKNKTNDKILSFHHGVEDYIEKPFDPEELKIRAEVRLKNHKKNLERNSIIKIGNLTINSPEQKVFLRLEDKENLITLTSTEFKIINFLGRNANRIFSREQLINEVWQYGFEISDRTVDSHISRLRKKISGSEYNIVAIMGAGYKLAKSSSEV